MANSLLILVFLLGYSAIIAESKIKVNKAASALLAGTLCWTIYMVFTNDKAIVITELFEHMGELSGILFFLLSAMTIVELIDAHDGFTIITDRISTRNKRNLLWIIGFITFFLSALLDNLTTTIIMVTLTRKLIHQEKDRWFFAGIIVIAANAGGAFSPMGDVTTTMLWIGGQISAMNIITRLFIPSVICLVIPLIASSLMISPGKAKPELHDAGNRKNDVSRLEKSVVFFVGIIGLVLVPVFKTLTGLPPFIGMLAALGTMWIVVELLHFRNVEKEKSPLSVNRALQRLDTPTILFFLGILLCIAALESSGILINLSNALNQSIGNQSTIVILIGLISAIVDNVPLVAAVQGMYPLSVFPMDDYLWEFLAYTTGTGGSILIIGSAAGVAAMGLERITFLWYLKKISWIAALGYFAGAASYILLTSSFHA